MLFVPIFFDFGIEHGRLLLFRELEA